jgi:hypothetical protein
MPKQSSEMACRLKNGIDVETYSLLRGIEHIRFPSEQPWDGIIVEYGEITKMMYDHFCKEIKSYYDIIQRERNICEYCKCIKLLFDTINHCLSPTTEKCHDIYICCGYNKKGNTCSHPDAKPYQCIRKCNVAEEDIKYFHDIIIPLANILHNNPPDAKDVVNIHIYQDKDYTGRTHYGEISTIYTTAHRIMMHVITSLFDSGDDTFINENVKRLCDADFITNRDITKNEFDLVWISYFNRKQ